MVSKSGLFRQYFPNLNRLLEYLFCTFFLLRVQPPLVPLPRLKALAGDEAHFKRRDRPRCRALPPPPALRTEAERLCPPSRSIVPVCFGGKNVGIRLLIRAAQNHAMLSRREDPATSAEDEYSGGGGGGGGGGGWNVRRLPLRETATCRHPRERQSSASTASSSPVRVVVVVVVVVVVIIAIVRQFRAPPPAPSGYRLTALPQRHRRRWQRRRGSPARAAARRKPQDGGQAAEMSGKRRVGGADGERAGFISRR